jgi:hypothetical protein
VLGDFMRERRRRRKRLLEVAEPVDDLSEQA